MRTLELLAPARNLECGIAAIDHGADAVYIGAQDLAHVLQPAILWMISDSYAAMPINIRQRCMLLSIPSFTILNSMIRWI